MINRQSLSNPVVADLIKKHDVVFMGQGRDILLFGHGFGCDKSIWNSVAPAFFAKHSVILFDYMGSGNSDLTQYSAEHYNGLESYADDVITLCNALELSNIIFVGHSVSGAIGMLASIAQPDLFKKLITIGPSPRYINENPDYFGGFDENDVMGLLEMMQLNYFEWANYLAPIVVGNADSPEYTQRLKQSFLSSDPVISCSFARVTFLSDIRTQLAKVSIPVDVLYCLNDAIVPLEVIEYLKNNLPNCTTYELDATGHYPQITNPAAVIAGIQRSIQ